ncbi:MAG: hypothetical protein K0R13_3281 [Propionibacteriaceae bacterium]|nr:hypothetical protein [Propionibacteriaceae bacterium]
MAIAALLTWLITAGVGFFMLIRWATRGGLREVPGAGTNFPRVRVFAHFGLAAAGLIVWIIYLVTGNTLWAWIAVADLILVALLGGSLCWAGCWSGNGQKTAVPPWRAPPDRTRPPRHQLPARLIWPSSTSRACRSCYTESSQSAPWSWCCSPHWASQADDRTRLIGSTYRSAIASWEVGRLPRVTMIMPPNLGLAAARSIPAGTSHTRITDSMILQCAP